MTVKKREIRTRVERLISGNNNPRDLDRIFSWLRFNSYGNSFVKDIGDFAEHSENKNKGVVHGHSTKVYNTIAFMFKRSLLESRGQKPDWTKKELFAALKGNIELCRPERLKAELPLGRQKTIAVLERAEKKTKTVDGLSLVDDGALTNQELSVIKIASSMMNTMPVYSDEVLFNDFVDILYKNDVLFSHEVEKISRIKYMIILSAIEKMHLSTLDLGNGKIATLKAGIDTNSEFHDSLCVNMVFNTELIDSGIATKVGFCSIFNTTCRATEYLDGFITNQLRDLDYWDRSLELSADSGKLHFF